ncbi:MAG: ribonuclease HII [Oscillatoria sp. PMC 1051.18]|uniref:ribonuclease HII n=1 Tax=Oscillatoria salina TaxID=331517 RepID=UPI001CCB9EC9|nr:ribonuclease HII [Oscillatoria salina]MBZ8178824.1 ribonuclease HII [Oscillatoria salina IIICB1]MEC4894631.1 ribonuclease HII [Oscillatoria sp. PMC 1050.18]MEC5031122.1 ribonuclease HII [Oscillatoria sp. PMC 1051.18]
MLDRVSTLGLDCSKPSKLFGTPGLIAGVDEVGRGALFGPVVAAAITIPSTSWEQLAKIGVRDSKQLSAKRRSELAQEMQRLSLSWSIAWASRKEIDRLNIFQASLLAMKRAVIKLKPQPAICLVDGKHQLPSLGVPQKNLVKGDERSPIIAAASIIAKVWRDELILRFAQKYPDYGLATNKGYGTKQHCLALQQYGPTSQHRMSFSPCQVSR